MTRQQKYIKTKKGVANAIYFAQKQHSKTRGHSEPTYTLKELKDWMFSQKLFHELYNNWKRLDYQRMYKPSVDRLDDNIGYTMSNIQLMTFGENDKKADKDAYSGKLKRKHRAVFQYDLDKNLLNSFKSMRIASRSTGVHDGQIKDNCKGRQLTAGGYIWEYQDKEG